MVPANQPCRPHTTIRNLRHTSANQAPAGPTTILNLRHSPANQAPAKSSKSYRPATGGGTSRAHAAMVASALARARPRQHPLIGRVPAETSVRRRRFPTDPAPTYPLDMRHISANSRVRPTRSNPWGAWARRRLAMRRRRRQGSRHVMVRPAARIPGESGQTGPGKNPQTRRRIRRTDDGSRRPPTRPGVTLAPGSAVSTSLLYHVFLEAPR